MRTVNTVIANIERIIKFSNKKQENMIYQYWKVGRELSHKNSVNKFGSNFIGNVTIGMKKKGIEDKVYNRRGLYRMIQFYEAYSDWYIYGEHLTEINWSSHILLLDGIEEKDRSFWIELCTNKKYSVRKIKEKIEKWKAGILFRAGDEIELLQLDEIEGKKTHKKYTFDKNTYVIPTQAELDRMKETYILKVDKNELVDINDVNIDESLPMYERICSYIDQVKNPYCYKVGNIVVKVEYTEGAPTLEELFNQKLSKMREQEEDEYSKWHPK